MFMDITFQNLNNEFIIYNDTDRHIELELSPLEEINIKEQNKYVNEGGIVILDKTQQKYFKILYS